MVLSADLKPGTAFYNLINISHEKYFSIVLVLQVRTLLYDKININKQCHIKVLLNDSLLPQTSKLELPKCIIVQFSEM